VVWNVVFKFRLLLYSSPMKFSIFLFLLSSLLACSTRKEYPQKDICFLLYNLASREFEEIRNEDNCKTALPATSTFKIPLALMAYDSHLINESHSLLHWNGEKYFVDSWNQDHTAESWMRESVIWYSQELTPRLGKLKIEFYLKTFGFGNADMSGGLKYAWLTPAPFVPGPVVNSLKINGFEQVYFLEKLWRGDIKVTQKAQKLTRQLLVKDVSMRGNVLMGKTGSGFIGPDNDLRVAWYVGYLKSQQADYIVVINFTDKEKLPVKTFGGSEAKDMGKKLLKKKKLW
jgi:beta-lactamase class D